MIKLKNIINEVVGFRPSGVPEPQNIGREIKRDFAKFFRTWDDEMTALKHYAQLFSKSSEETQEQAAEILQEMDTIATTIEEMLYNSKISDN